MDGEFVINHHEAFRWTEQAGMIGLSSYPGGEFASNALAISDDGNVIVGSGGGQDGMEAFRWTAEDGVVGLGILPQLEPHLTPYSIAYGVSADGSVIVGDSIQQAFVWDERHGLRSIESILTAAGVDLTGWRLLRAMNASADGRTIVGYGVVGDGPELLWVAVLPENVFGVPEPKSGLMIAICCSLALLMYPRQPRQQGS